MARGGEEDRWERYLRKLGIAVEGVQNCTHVGQGRGPVVHDLRFKLEQDNRTSVLIIVKAHSDGQELVGFVGALDLGTALITLEGKLRAGTLRWREDRPWRPQEGV